MLALKEASEKVVKIGQVVKDNQPRPNPANIPVLCNYPLKSSSVGTRIFVKNVNKSKHFIDSSKQIFGYLLVSTLDIQGVPLKISICWYMLVFISIFSNYQHSFKKAYSL